MKWMFGLIFTGFLFTACDNELVVTDKWKDIPIVWAFLSKSDTAVYIRVEKAFLDPNVSADSIALIADSLYYPNAVVKLKRIASGQEYTLTRVDGSLEGYPREDGAFAQFPNYLYKIKGNIINLVVGDEYQFILKRNEQADLVTAETIILPAPVLRNPSPGTNLLFKPNVTFTFSWNEIPDAGVYDLQMRFNYSEKSPETGNLFIPLSVQWTIAQGIEDPEGSTDPGYKMDGAEFYNSVSANIDVDPDATRLFESIDIIVWCGGKEFQDYQTITLANTGLTSTQEIPEYTNLSEGKGIFTSRGVSYNMDFGLHNQSLDSLKNGSVTGDLNFQ
ncbi:MAG TPA: hypothetical protein PLV75_13905 [Saprospiraceae bacterium]|nr:hypothetical protein [Saprospiraceae bacterium]